MTGLTTDTDGRLCLATRSLCVGDNLATVAELVLLAVPGEIKEYPLLGAAATQHLGATTDILWPQEARSMLRAAHIDVERVRLADGVLTID